MEHTDISLNKNIWRKITDKDIFVSKIAGSPVNLGYLPISKYQKILYHLDYIGLLKSDRENEFYTVVNNFNFERVTTNAEGRDMFVVEKMLVGDCYHRQTWRGIFKKGPGKRG